MAGFRVPDLPALTADELAANDQMIVFDASEGKTKSLPVGAFSDPVSTKANALAIGIAADADNMGAFTGDILPDNVSAKSALQALSDAIEVVADTDGVFLQVGAGAVPRPYLDKMRDAVNVKDFGAVGDGAVDDTAAFAAAIAVNGNVVVPVGTYRINLNINRKVVMVGAGAQDTIIKPYNDAVAAMTYTAASSSNPVLEYWVYHSRIENMSFRGNGTKTGVGFTFGKTNVADFAEGDQYASGVSFRNCFFRNLEKGVQFPFGNIGNSFYDCGWTACKYGVYMLNCKNSSSGIMHAGNKYFYNGEMNNCDCAVYVHNRIDGFGAIIFNGTIFEHNMIAAYLDIDKTFVPITFNGCWNETNGSAKGGSSTIDQWVGTTRSDQVVLNKTVVIAGPPGLTMDPMPAQVIINDGTSGDIHIKHERAQVTINRSRVESVIGYGGGTFVVDYPLSSTITLRDPVSDGGVGGTYFPLLEGHLRVGGTMQTTVRTYSRGVRVKARDSKVASYGPSKAVSFDFTTAASTAGAFVLTGVVVADGRLYANCNEFTRTGGWTSSQFTRVNSPELQVAVTPGWFVFTVDIKVVSGAGVTVAVWDRGANQLAAIVANDVGAWRTYAGIAYTGASHNLFLDFTGNGGDTVFRISAYQLHKFATFEEASDFLNGGAFVT